MTTERHPARRSRRHMMGLAGSERPENARALRALLQRGEPEDGKPLGEGRMPWALERKGSPLIQGAAAAARVLLGREAPEHRGAAGAPGWTRRRRLAHDRPGRP